MQLEKNIRSSLERSASTIEPPASFDALVKRRMKQRGKLGVKGALLAAACLVILLFGATAFTVPSLADRIYGSFELLKRQAVTLTLQQYQHFGLKLSGAYAELRGDYPRFEQLVRTITAAKVAYGRDGMNNIDFDAMPAKKREQVRAAYLDIQPFFDRLNGDPIARERLTTAQYEAYIDATIRRETLYAQTDLRYGSPVSAAPTERQAEYEQALRTIGEMERLIRRSD